jgi:hypothetical protein
MATILQWAKNDPTLANEIKLLLLRNRTATPAKEDSDRHIPGGLVTPKPSKAVDFMEVPEPSLARFLPPPRICHLAVLLTFIFSPIGS